jgi:Kef-type K+ transport system membrane component KefB
MWAQLGLVLLFFAIWVWVRIKRLSFFERHPMCLTIVESTIQIGIGCGFLVLAYEIPPFAPLDLWTPPLIFVGIGLLVAGPLVLFSTVEEKLHQHRQEEANQAIK